MKTFTMDPTRAKSEVMKTSTVDNNGDYGRKRDRDDVRGGESSSKSLSTSTLQKVPTESSGMMCSIPKVIDNNTTTSAVASVCTTNNNNKSSAKMNAASSTPPYNDNTNNAAADAVDDVAARQQLIDLIDKENAGAQRPPLQKDYLPSLSSPRTSSSTAASSADTSHSTSTTPLLLPPKVLVVTTDHEHEHQQDEKKETEEEDVEEEQSITTTNDQILLVGDDKDVDGATSTTSKERRRPLLLVLISSRSFQRDAAAAANQRLACAALDSKGIAYETLDGADPQNEVVRNDLFAISGLRGAYPQFFVIENNVMSFWGGWDRFVTANETGTLVDELLCGGGDSGGAARSTIATTDDDDDDDDDGGLVNAAVVHVHHQAVADDESRSETAGTALTGGSADTTTTTTTTTATTSNNNCFLLLVLVSSQSLLREVTAHQVRAFTILNAKGISYDTLDGADPANKDRRNELFALSGMRGKYPQFFLQLVEKKNSGGGDSSRTTTTFWGDWDRFEAANEIGILVDELGGGGGGTESTPANTATNTNVSDTGRGTGGTSSGESEQESPASQGENKAAIDSKAVADAAETKDLEKETDITIYGATSFVARHVLNYLRKVSLAFPQDLTVTLAGRNRSKLESLRDDNTKKMANLNTVMGETGKCVFDVMVAESNDVGALDKMAERTRVVLNCAGPFAKYSNNVVAACAKVGTDYVDITGEIGWAGQMREKYGKLSAKSGARIISFCGFDSIPSDLSVFMAVEALREATKTHSVDVELATTWHDSLGGVNGGTLSTVVDMPLGLSKLLQWVPFLQDDPLALTHPKVKSDPTIQETRNRLALAEWFNQLPAVDSILRLGISLPFFMAIVNAKIVHASAIALKYGSNFRYRERMVPSGFRMTIHLSLLSVIPAILTQAAIIFAFIILKSPVVGRALVNWLLPPGTGSSDQWCKAGYAHVYAEVSTAPNEAGACDKANCLVKFQGDPGNWVTAQCVTESALNLLYDKKDLPQRSDDGFGTPAELLGKPLLRRLQNSTRPVVVETHVRKGVGREWRMYP